MTPRKTPQATSNNYEAMQALIGRRIRANRKALRLTQMDLARAVGKHSATYIALIEDGKRRVSAIDLLRIAGELGMSAAYLFAGEFEDAPSDVPFAIKANKRLSLQDKKVLLYLFTLMTK